MASLLYKWCLLSLTLLVGGSFASKPVMPETVPHPFYISVTEINHNAKDKTLEISCKMFAEDLEQVLEKNYKTTLDISLAKDKANFDRLIPDYISKHLQLAVDGRPVKLSYVGFEKEKESVFCYVEVDGISTVKKLDMVNNLLHDFSTEQINLMHVTVNGKRQSTKLNYPEVKASFNF